ncbi:MAG TPA: hypothetical protein VGU66_20700 [Candidatus Elarobacter sp.]|nr:hypothetical protein [Candidatus Elarobacter sp.]
MLSEKDGTGAEGALRKAADAGFEITGTPYADFIESYFGTTGPARRAG